MRQRALGGAHDLSRSVGNFSARPVELSASFSAMAPPIPIGIRTRAFAGSTDSSDPGKDTSAASRITGPLLTRPISSPSSLTTGPPEAPGKVGMSRTMTVGNGAKASDTVIVRSTTAT